MPDDAQSKQLVSSILRQFGFEVFVIPEEPGRHTADVKAIHTVDTFIIEIKDKTDNPEQIRLEEARLEAGEWVNKAEPVGPRNRLSAIIRNAADQLSTYEPGPHTFRVLWFNAFGQDAQLQWMRFRSTLYGSKLIHDLITGAPSLDCYYFEHSAFFALGDSIDAAIAFWDTEHGTEWALCINSYSPRKENIRQTALYRLFAPPNDAGLYDPELLEKAGKAYFADCEIDRRDSQGNLNYLRAKYGNPNLTDQPEMNWYSGAKYFPA